MKKNVIVVLLALSVVVAGCAMQAPAEKQQQQGSQGEKQISVDPGMAEKVKQAAQTVKGVEDITAVVINNEISAAIKVSGFNRLRLKSIRQEVHRKIKEAGGDYKVNVTSDKKLFAGLRQIETQLSAGQVQSMTEIQKKIDKINKDMRG